MAQKKSYSRYFIILQEDEKGYSLASDKIASGYAKLETKSDKCKISYYVQNLKKDKTPYYMILICNKKDVKKMINIGEMNIDDYGRADISYEYAVDNVCDSGIPMDRISGAAIVRILDNNIIAVMSGFASMEIPDWKSFQIINHKTKKAEVPEPRNDEKIEVNKKHDKKSKKVEAKETAEPKVTNEKENKSIFDKYEQNIEMEKKAVQTSKEQRTKDKVKADKQKNDILNIEHNVEDAVKNIKEDTIEKKKKVQEEQVKEEVSVKDKASSLENQKDEVEVNRIKSDSTMPEKDKLEKDKEEIYIDNSSTKLDENYRIENENSKDNFFESLVHEFNEIPNLNKELKRCRWYRVPVVPMDNMKSMSGSNKYEFIYHPMAPYYSYVEKYKHFLVGYKYDKNENIKYLIYGIPGEKSKEAQPYGGRSGFVTWISGKDKDDLGYWLMFYDFKTGIIQIPVKK